jgi:hypothetical protein
MQIDYIKNPLGIIKKFDILYGKSEEDLHLEGRVIAHMEDGFDDVTWYSGEVLYKNGWQIGGLEKYDKLYQDLRRGAPTIMEVKLKLKRWCDSWNRKIASEEDITVGVRYFNQRISTSVGSI